MKKILNLFRTARTEIVSEMLDNPNEIGIYPTSQCFDDMDGAFRLLSRQVAIQFAAEYVYRKANPTSKMDVPSIALEYVEKAFDKWSEEK